MQAPQEDLGAAFQPAMAHARVSQGDIQIREFAEHISRLPRVERSPDPGDDFLLALAEAGKADYLVTGDKAGLLSLRTHKTTRIVSASQFARLFAPSRKRHLHQRGIKPER